MSCRVGTASPTCSSRHDLRVVRALANQLMVMRNGKVVEHGRLPNLCRAAVRLHPRPDGRRLRRRSGAVSGGGAVINALPERAAPPRTPALVPRPRPLSLLNSDNTFSPEWRPSCA